MAQEDPNRLSEWFELGRKQVPVVRQSVEDWLQEVRREPRMIWETRAVRYATYGLVGLVLLRMALGLAGAVGPASTPPTKPRATSADFHVVCTNRACGRHFVIHREFGFRKFPVVCPKCQQKTGVRARRCYSPSCRGRWVAPVRRDGALSCPHCNQELP
jgi:hypothetical protein